MALERAVVTTSESGALEILGDGETGIIVPPRDTEALKRALLELIRDPEGARQMGLEARRRAIDRFNFPKMIRIYEGFYEETMRLRSEGARMMGAARRTV